MKNNIVGIGCDMQTELDVNSRKLAIESLTGSEKDRVDWMIKHMSENKAYKYKVANKNEKEKGIILQELKNDYLSYRKNWMQQPKQALSNRLHGEKLKNQNVLPLCFDLEVASVCDLACGFCYRQYISTPDKIMKKN